VHVLPHHLRTEEKVMDSTDIHPVIWVHDKFVGDDLGDEADLGF
jgi:hypothetical protein